MRLSVDVVVPTRNQAQYIAQCLDSVRAQTFQPNRVIVVNDGSTDQTAAILERYGRSWDRLQIHSIQPHGASYARNVGISASTAPLVAFLDSDDLWMPDKLERQVPMFSNDDAVGVVHCGIQQIDESGQLILPELLPTARGDIFDKMITEFYHLIGSASGVVARRELVMAVGGFDEALVYSEDQDLWLKLAHISKVDFVSAVLVTLRFHSRGTYAVATKRNPERLLLARLTVWNRWIEYFRQKPDTIQHLRREVVRTSRAKRSPAGFPLLLYARLKHSKLPIVELLFPTFRNYCSALRDRDLR